MQAPRDKLVCVLNCCRVINNLLHVADNDGNEARGIKSPLALPFFRFPCMCFVKLVKLRLSRIHISKKIQS